MDWLEEQERDCTLSCCVGRGVDVGGALHSFGKENLPFKYVVMHWDDAGGVS